VLPWGIRIWSDADAARIETAEAQVKTAQALLEQATDPGDRGTSPMIDGLRAKVNSQTRQQQLIQAKNNFAIQKLTLARVIGLAPARSSSLRTSRRIVRSRESVDDALKHAYNSRSDYQRRWRCARGAFARKAATAVTSRRFSFNADYGGGGSHPSRQPRCSTCRDAVDSDLPGSSVHAMFCRPIARLEQNGSGWITSAGRFDAMCARHCSIWNHQRNR